MVASTVEEGHNFSADEYDTTLPLLTQLDAAEPSNPNQANSYP